MPPTAIQFQPAPGTTAGGNDPIRLHNPHALSATVPLDEVMLGIRISVFPQQLTGDKILNAILNEWARQPWREVHRNALVDRMLELGYDGAAQWARSFDELWFELWTEAIDTQPRRSVRRSVKLWRDRLRYTFGWF